MFHHHNACQFCAQKSLTAFSASENVSNLMPTFNSTAIFTTNTDYSKTSFEILCTSMVTSLCEKQGTNWKDSAQINEDVSRTKEITISSKTGMFESVDSWRTKSSCRFNRSLGYKSNLRHHFFSERVINNWNNLDNKTDIWINQHLQRESGKTQTVKRDRSVCWQLMLYLTFWGWAVPSVRPRQVSFREVVRILLKRVPIGYTDNSLECVNLSVCAILTITFTLQIK